MVKRVSLPYLMTTGGRTYFRRRGCKTIRLPDPASPDFLDAYNAAKRGRPPAPARTSISALVDSYVASDRWNRLSSRTKADYRKVLDYLREKLGARDVSVLTMPLIVEAMEANRHRARFANYIGQVARILCRHAVKIGWLKANPLLGVEMLPLGDGWEPWPDAAQDAYRKVAEPLALLIFEMSRGSGQRIGDVLKMRWDEIEDGGIWVAQNKAQRKGKRVERLWIPLSDRLLALLAETPRKGFTIIAGKDSRPLSYRAASYAVMQARVASGTKEWNVHGLRSNRASELYEAGCTDAEVQSITGHKSAAQARRYGRGARQRKLAEAAVRKLREMNGGDG